MRVNNPVRWGLLGTANIVLREFLPALRAAGGRAVAVGSRSLERGAPWAAEHGIERATSYDDVLAADDIDAVYIPLPNDLHLEWAVRAAAAGKAVLCEKPFGLDAASVARTVEQTGPDALVWEAFVFPFHPQTQLLQERIGAGDIGTFGHVDSQFHFPLEPGPDIRLSPQRGGGALYDVGCYPIRLARLLFGGEPTTAGGLAQYRGGVDVVSSGVADFAGAGWLRWSAGFDGMGFTFTRLAGTTGELHVTNPFHPTASDRVRLCSPTGEVRQTWTPAPGSAFEHGLRHIHAVLAGVEAPRHRIVDDAVGQAAAIDLIRAGLRDAAAPSVTPTAIPARRSHDSG
jgi:predicted dehydrogenase